MGVKKELEAAGKALDSAKKAIDDALKSYEAKKKKIEPDLKKLKDTLKAVGAVIDKVPFDSGKAKSLITQATGTVAEAEKETAQE